MKIIGLVIISLLFVACSKDHSTDKGQKNETAKLEDMDENGVLTYGVDQEIGDKWQSGYIENALDSEISQFIHEDLLVKDEDMKWKANLASFETKDDETYTFTLKKGIKWHNGEKLTMNDWKFALEVLANPNYDGPHEHAVDNVQGVQAYKDGTVDSIAGIKVIDDYKAEIQFREKRADNLEHLWLRPLPEKELKDIPVGELAKNKDAQQKPVGLGPFKVAKQSNKELKLERFDDYWQEKPQLKGIDVKYVKHGDMLQALQDGEVDLTDIRHEESPIVQKDINDVSVKKENGLSYAYIGFRFGSYDSEQEQSIEDFDKFNDKSLRQAMYFALDRESLIKDYMNDSATVLNTPIPKAFWTHTDKDLDAYKFNQDKAKKLLDEAGYKDTNDDGFRETPEGEPLKITFTHYEGPHFEKRTKAMLKNWQDVGLNIKLKDDKLTSYKDFEKMKETDSAELELYYDAAVQTTTDPSVLWHSSSQWNSGHWNDSKSNQYLEKALQTSVKDTKEQEKTYAKWQKHFNEEIPALILWENQSLYAVNEKLGNIAFKSTGFKDTHKWFKTK